MKQPDNRKYSAGPALCLGFGGTAVLLGGAIAWSVFAPVSGAVIAAGSVAVETRNQMVEHIDGGAVSEILVRDGDRVARNDVLLRLSDTLLRTEEAILAGKCVDLVTRRNRLEAEFRGSDAIAWDSDLAALAAADPRVTESLDGQERLFRARVVARDGEVLRLREQIGQARAEITGLEARGESLAEQSALIARELESQRALFDEGLTILSQVLGLERAAKELEGQSGTVIAQIARVRGRISELEIQILQIDSRRIEEAESQARDVSAQEDQVKEHLASVRERLGRMEVRAPVAGDVFGMTVFAPREVVRPGEPILQIVPEDAGLVVMARLNPTDVDQVYPGQPAVLRFSAFPARTTPEFDGHVERVSADAMRDDRTGLSWYEVELSMDSPAAAADNGTRSRDVKDSRRLFGDLPLTPGMPVEAHIRTGERTVVSYLVKPVSDFLARSLREE